ncbi:MAG: DNA-formamidopyrimidine glycosylase family protein [Verrucomicrobiota bacterium]
MPELAEVEFARKQWDPGVGMAVSRVLTHPKARIYREIPAAAVQRGLTGRTLLGSEAHGKQMLFQFSGGAWLGIHLGMTGKLFVADPNYEVIKRDHLVLEGRDRVLVFSDYRMFGKLTLDLAGPETPPQWWQDLPPRVTDRKFTKKRHAAFVKRFPKTPIKTLLLDQRGYPGIGNWMADEICWRLSIPPQTKAGDLKDEQLDAIWKATRAISSHSLRTIGVDYR